MSSKHVRVHEFGSAMEAELATAALSEAGIDATIQGRAAGQLLAILAPARFPVLVAADQADAAREVLRNLVVSEPTRASDSEECPPTKARRWRIMRAIVGLHIFALMVTVGIALMTILVVAVADVFHATPHGHMIDAPVPFRYLVATFAVLLTFSRWARSKGVVIFVALTIVFMAISITPRVDPVSPQRPMPSARSPW